MKNTQKLLSLLLVLAMLFAMAPAAVTVSAEEIASGETIPAEETPSEETTTAASGEVDSYDAGIPTLTGSSEIPFRLNPLYEGILDADHFPEADFSHMQGDTSAVQSDYVSATDAAAQIRNNMLNRVSEYTIYVRSENSDGQEVIDVLVADALAHNGNPKEGDCLMWVYGGLSGGYDYTYSSGTYYYTFDIYMPYYTTYAQEVELDAAVASLLSQLNLWDRSDYEKVCAVYDYICDTVEYDYEHLNDDFYDLQYTAYAALVNEIAVCQGYSVLFYRLMLELGVDSRVIVGDGGGPHAWNIVELDNLYYNLDSTWDAGAASYSYFLQSPLDFTGHTREPEYETAEFHAAYPMSPTSYGREPVVIEATPITTDTWYTARIDTPDTVVYYSFTPAESGYYTLSADSNGSDTRCSLYNAGWSVIDSNDDSNDSYDFSLTAWLDAGQTYYYGVDYYGDTTGSFEILLTKEEGGSSSDDEIYALTQDVPVMFNVSAGGWVDCSFTPAESGYYVLSAYSYDDTYCNLFDADWNHLGSNDDTGEGRNFFLNAWLDAGETYYYEFFFYFTDITGTIQVVVTDGLAPSETKVENLLADNYAVTDLVLGTDGIYRTPTGYPMYIAIHNLCDGGLTWLDGDTLYDIAQYRGSTVLDMTWMDELVDLMDADGYVLLTETTLQYLITTITGNPNWEETEEYAGKYLFYDTGADPQPEPEPEPEPEPDILPLTLDVPATVTIAVGGGHGCYFFTPEYTGFYCLTAMSGEDTLCELYDMVGEYLNGDDDSGEGQNFSLQAYLQAGQTYYFDVYYYDPGLTGSFQILLTEADGLTESGKIENNIAAFYAVSDLTLGDDGIYRTPDGGTVYIGVDNVGDGGLTWLSGNTLYECVDLYGSEAFDLTHWDALVALMDADGYVLLTPTSLQYLITTITGNPVWQETEADVARYLFHDPAPRDSDILAGDVNGDGEIDILDANLVVAWYNEIRDLDDDQLLAADVNRDGEVDIMDANMIVAYYNEIIDAFPVG